MNTLQTMLIDYFTHEENIDIYVINNDTQNKALLLEKLPMFYKICLTQPENLSAFLKSLTQSMAKMEDVNTPVYKGANVFTLITFAMFHLMKISDEQYHRRYIKEYIKFLHNMQAYPVIDFNQRIEGFASPLTYILLLSWAYYNKDVNLFTEYLLLISKTSSDKNNINVLQDIVRPLLEDEYKDIYGYDLRKLEHNYMATTYLTPILHKNHLFANILKNRSSGNSGIYEYVHPMLKTLATSDPADYSVFQKFELICFINKRIITFLHVGHNDPRWQEIVDLIWHFIHDIDDLEKIDSILYKFDSTEFYDPKLFFNRTTKENIIFPFLSNTIKCNKN